MCLILIAIDQHDEYSIVLAANRDEFFQRPTAPADFWDDTPHILGGRDLSKGGGWLGVSRQGRWCAVTNFRDGRQETPAGPSRGSLVSRFLAGNLEPSEFAAGLDADGPRAGYNLVMGNSTSSGYASNRGAPFTTLSTGVYGLSNHLLDTPWRKVQRGKILLRHALNASGDGLRTRLFRILSDRTPAADDELPDTGVGLERERMLSPAFIHAPGYGTRCSTVLLVGRAGDIFFEERAFNEQQDPLPVRRFAFRTQP